jgi:hypothetical protein
MSDNDDLTLEELALRDKLLSVWQDTLVYQQLPFWPTENMSPLAVDMESLPWLPAPRRAGAVATTVR